MGGQGVISLGNLIGYAAMFENKNVSIVPSYGAEMRGGISTCFVTISDEAIGSPIFIESDSAILMYQLAMDQFGKDVNKDGIIIYNNNMVTHEVKQNDVEFISIPANSEALKLKDVRAANVILFGAWCKVKQILKPKSIQKAIKEMFKSKNQMIVDINYKAFEFGYNFIK